MPPGTSTRAVVVRERSRSKSSRPRILGVHAEPVSGIPTPPLPTKATSESACFDLYAAESVTLRSGAVQLVRTGLRLRPPRGMFLEVRPRSGLSTRGVLMVNAPGTIDRDYAGEVKVPLTYLFAGEYAIRFGDRIGQIRVVPEQPSQFRLGRVRPTTDRRGGFGSTGR
jgi:dUTP pyrophosphatase